MILRAALLSYILLLTGCGVASKQELMTPELRSEQPEIQNTSTPPAIQTIEITAENFQIQENVVPDGNEIKRVKIIGAELRDVISLLTEATDENIIFQLE